MIAKLEEKVTRNQDKAQFIFVWKKKHTFDHTSAIYNKKEFVFPKKLQKICRATGGKWCIIVQR